MTGPRKGRRIRGLLAVALAGSWALAQVPYAQPDGGYERQNPTLSPREEAAIEANRKAARPRPMAPRKPLSPLEKERVKVFKEAKGSVVYIASITKMRFMNTQTGDQFTVPPGTGTGFIWDELGHVVTNHHVITVDDPNGVPRREAEELEVTFSNGKTYKARVIGRSLAHDIAVLQVFAPLSLMKPLPLGDSGDLEVGQSVMAIGNPFGLNQTLTAGVVSALGREIPTDFGQRINGAIQTDAAINPGNSGGPLLDHGGRLVGMNTAIESTLGFNMGIGFAIPVSTLNRIVPILIAKGQINRPSLGFTTLEGPSAAYLGVHKGIAVAAVEPGSPADRAGMKGLTIKAGVANPKLGDVEALGDVIMSYKGLALDSDIQLMDILELEPPDAILEFEVLAEGRIQKRILRPQERSDGPAGPAGAGTSI